MAGVSFVCVCAFESAGRAARERERKRERGRATANATHLVAPLVGESDATLLHRLQHLERLARVDGLERLDVRDFFADVVVVGLAALGD